MKTLFVAITACLSALSFSQSPKLTIDKHFKFETLDQGNKCEHDFIVNKTGEEFLVISMVKTSCGCDVASWPKEPIGTGDSAIITYKYDSNRLGPFTKSMTIQSNDKDNQSVVVRIQGQIIATKKTNSQSLPVK
jgi:hypothetical protein